MKSELWVNQRIHNKMKKENYRNELSENGMKI